MNHDPVINISTQQVQIFLKAVERRNFTQVANYYNYTPSMISKTIASLENELGITLFERKPHELIPTESALMLARDWRYFISSFKGSIKKARMVQEKLQSRIVLGFVDSSDEMDSAIAGIIRVFSTSHPEITITAEKHDMHRSAELLQSGMLDIIITSETEVPYLDSHGIPWQKVFDTNVAVFVPSGNELFGKDDIEVSDLKDQPVTALDPTMHPTYNQWMLGFCKDKGFVPNIVSTYRTVRSLRFSLGIRDAIFIGDSVNQDWENDDLKAFILPDRSFSLLAWNPGAGSALNEFKDYLIKKL